MSNLSFAPVGRVLVLGDVIADIYHKGSVERLSAEASVPVLRAESEAVYPGGAGNVAMNLRGAGMAVALCAVVGADDIGARVRGALEAAEVDCTHLYARPERPTASKRRYMDQYGQQLLCVDDEGRAAFPDAFGQRVAQMLEAHVRDFACVIISEYRDGFLTEAVRRAAQAACDAANVPLLVDSKHMNRYTGACLVKPNRKELAQAVGSALATHEEVLAAARAYRRQQGHQWLLATLSQQGMFLLGPEGQAHVLPALQVDRPNVTGAGDVVIAYYAAGMAMGLSPAEGLALARDAAYCKLRKAGTAPVFMDEVLAMRGSTGGKVLALEALVRRLAAARPPKVVLTNGCFDLLHAGHVQSLQAAAREGDMLIVGLNSDASVRALKGVGRPVIAQAERAATLAALSCVDYVVIFAEDTPVHLIEALRPDVYAKGQDYRAEDLPGYDVIMGYGGRVALLPLAPDVSTSGVIERIKGRQA